MVKKILFGFAALALAVASAATSYKVTFYEPVMVNGSELKPGDYKLEIKDKTAVLSQGKTTAEAPITVQTEAQKFQRTAVRLDGMKVDEIRIGGTTTRIVFDKTSNATN